MGSAFAIKPYALINDIVSLGFDRWVSIVGFQLKPAFESGILALEVHTPDSLQLKQLGLTKTTHDLLNAFRSLATAFYNAKPDQPLF